MNSILCQSGGNTPVSFVRNGPKEIIFKGNLLMYVFTKHFWIYSMYSSINFRYRSIGNVFIVYKFEFSSKKDFTLLFKAQPATLFDRGTNKRVKLGEQPKESKLCPLSLCLHLTWLEKPCSCSVYSALPPGTNQKLWI